MKLSGFTKLTVITNGINLAMALKDIPGITVILTGGIVTSVSSSIEGLLGEDLLKKIHTDTLGAVNHRAVYLFFNDY